MKSQRHRSIIEIVEKKLVETQEELAAELRQRGYTVTQATVSRDIRELCLIKVATRDNRYRYAIPGEKVPVADRAKARRVFHDSVTGMELSENIIAVKTTPGSAQSVALVIDNEGWREIIGTVAGDDTVLVVVKPKSAGPQVLKEFKAYLL